MGVVYGRSLAANLIQQGKYDEAIAEATRAITQSEVDVIAWFDRACARTALGQHVEAVADIEAAVKHDDGLDELDLDVVDDAYFTALLSVARAMPTGAAGASYLVRYRELFPTGAHLGDVVEWQARLRGEVELKPIVIER